MWVSAISKQRCIYTVLLVTLSIFAALIMPFYALPSVSAEQTSAWNSLASMPTARADFGIVALEGKIYVIGGINGAGEPLATVEVYNPVNNDWTSKMPMLIPRSGFAAAAYGGKIYVFGGNISSGFVGNAEVYDPDSNSWTTVASMPTPRAYLCANVVGDKIYVIGGEKYSSTNPYYVETGINECYDPATDTWTTKAALPTAVYGFGSAVVDNKIYVIGGAKQDHSSSMTLVGNNQVYNSDTDKWSISQSTPQTTVYGAAAATRGISSFVAVYFVGGYTINEFSNKTFAFMLSNNTWRTVEDMPTARSRLGLVVVDDVLYAIGGFDGAHWLGTAEKYIPVGYGTVAPMIYITSPSNETYQQVLLTYTVNKDVSWVGYSIDNNANVTVTNSIRLSRLSQGGHQIVLYANDSSGNVGVSNTVYFSIDTVAPTLSILNPTNSSYGATDVQLLFSVDETNASLAYSLDGQSTVDIIGNITLVALSNGGHYVTVYATDGLGNIAEQTVYFEIAPFPWLLVVAVLTIVIIVVAAAYIVLKMKGKSK
jgi:N-acetylneuraminic acid mutarotase